jgi:hypothetical protein
VKSTKPPGTRHPASIHRQSSLTKTRTDLIKQLRGVSQIVGPIDEGSAYPFGNWGAPTVRCENYADVGTV